jgi:hypothetical protein
LRDTITVLRTASRRKRLTKVYRADGSVQAFDRVAQFVVDAEVRVRTFTDLLRLLMAIENDPTRCVVRGDVHPDVVQGAGGERVRRVSKVPKDDPTITPPFRPAARQWAAIDVDESTTPYDPEDPEGSAAQWFEDVGARLGIKACVWQWSSSAHRSPTVRGRAWVLLDRPHTDLEMRAWAGTWGIDDSHYTAVAIHYTAAPKWEKHCDACGGPGNGPCAECNGSGVVPDSDADPLAGRRLLVLGDPSDGPCVLLPGEGVAVEARPALTALDLEANAEAVHDDPRAQALLQSLPLASECHGRKWPLCGALGGVWRRMLVPEDSAVAACTAWLAEAAEGDTSVDVAAGVAHMRGAYQRPAVEVSGVDTLQPLLGEAITGGVVDAALGCTGLGARALAARQEREDAADPLAHADPSMYTEQPLILQSTKDGRVALWQGDERGHASITISALRLRIRELGLPIELKGADGGSIAAGTVVEANGTTFDNYARDFAAGVSRYERDSRTLIEGYPDACTVPGVFDADVDAWLRAMGGRQYERLAVWVASCVQRNIGRLSAALVMLGPADVGKSLFAAACAGLWGEAACPTANLLIARFNGGLAKCPVVFDDECRLFGSRDLSTKAFRDLMQKPERQVEPKGLEAYTLRGCTRLIVAGNEAGDLRFDDVTGPDVVKAVADRLLVIDAKPRAVEAQAALARLRGDGAWTVDLARVVAHFAWLGETVALPAERFLAAGDGAVAAAAVLAGHAEASVDAWDSLREWLDAPHGERDVRVWSVHGGRLCVDPRALRDVLDDTHRWDAVRVREALRPFLEREVRPRVGMGRPRPRLWQLDALKVCESCSVAPRALAGRLGL